MGPALIANVEVIVGVGGTLSSQDAVMGILDGKPGNGRTEAGLEFHAFEDEVDAERMATHHAPQVEEDVFFLAHSFFDPLQGNVAFLGEGLHTAVVIIGALPQDLFADGLDLVKVAEEVDDVLCG